MTKASKSYREKEGDFVHSELSTVELYRIPHLCNKMPSHDSRGNNLEVLEGICAGY